MEVKNSILEFENYGFGLFVHLGLYSVLGKGEWARFNLNIKEEKYRLLTKKFKLKKTWAKELVLTAKKAGCKYVVLTARHHDGFSLYDTLGLSDYDAMHSASKRDLVKEFVDECNSAGLVPFLYHTHNDWGHKDYENDFNKYLEYLDKSVEIICTKYGKIGGVWFDGMIDKPYADWQDDKIFSTIRKHQKDAVIINNFNYVGYGKKTHEELDSMVCKLGKPYIPAEGEKYRAGEMYQTACDHWGFAQNDINYKSVKEILNSLITSRLNNCNLLLNIGPMGNGIIHTIDKGMLEEVGKWIKFNKNFIYKAKGCDVTAQNADVLYDGEYYYAIIKDVPMRVDTSAKANQDLTTIKINANIDNAVWLDSGKKIKILKDNSFKVTPFGYGKSMNIRVAKFTLK